MRARLTEHPGLHAPFDVDHQRLARGDIAQAGESEDVERHRFRRHRMFDAALGFAAPEHERANAVRITECHQPKAKHQGDDRVATLAAAVHTLHRMHHRFGAEHPLVVQLVREYVEQHLGIGLGVDVAPVLLKHFAAQRFGVDQIPVVRHRDAVGRVDVERLRFVGTLRAGGGIAAMANADRAAEQFHRRLVEHVLDQAIALEHLHAAFVRGGDARRVLAAMLQHGETVVERASDFAATDDSDDSAHGCFTCWGTLRGEVPARAA